MAILNRIARFFNSWDKVPLEDFAVEALTGTLESNSRLLDEFTFKVLGIKGNSFKIKSQRLYRLPDEEKNCRPDIVISNHRSVCFLEIKVEAKEGKDQLPRYAKALRHHFPKDWPTYLRYCTKYEDSKTDCYCSEDPKPDDCSCEFFQQFRWKDIAAFFKPYAGRDPLIADFIEFLKHYNMGTPDDFTVKDLFLMQDMGRVMDKLEAYMQEIKPKFEELFGRINGDTDAGKNIQLRTKDRYIIYKLNVLGKGDSEIGAGFDLSENPSLQVWVWLADEKARDALSKAIDSSADIENTDVEGLKFETPLLEFIGKPKSDEKIIYWFFEKFDRLKQFIKDTPELRWKLE